MTLAITKSGRQFGYVIWTKKTNPEMRALLGDRTAIPVLVNGLSIGVKSIDWKYHRISIGFKFTRALPLSAKSFKLELHDGKLEVNAI